MNTLKFRRLTASMVLASIIGGSLSGCVSPDYISSVRGAADEFGVQNDRAKADFLDKVRRKRERIEAAEDVDVPYLAGRPVVLSREATLPLALQSKTLTVIDLGGNGQSRMVSLETAVQKLSQATGIQFRIDSDVYLPASMLLPRNVGSASNSGASNSGAVSTLEARALARSESPVAQIKNGPLPPLETIGGGGGVAAQVVTPASSAGGLMVELPDSKGHPASEIADMFANRLGISWEYDPVKRMGRFYRLVTKTYKIPLGGGKRSFSNEFKSSSQQINSTTGGSSLNTDPTTQVKVESSEQTVALQKIVDQLNPVLTRAGNVAFNDDTGTITLTDTREAVENADKVIKAQVAVLSRLVSLNFQTVQVTVNDDREAGFDWTAVIQGALRNVPGLALGAAPASLVSANAGTAGFSVLSGAFTGTTAVVKALSEIGDASTSISVPLTMRNRRPATYDTSHLFYFLSGSSGAVGAVGGSGGVPGYTQSSGSVGFKLFIYPDADDNNDVNLSLAFDNSVLNAITPVTTGSGVNQQTFQQPDINRSGVGGQEITVHNGETMLVTGFEQANNQYSRRGFGAKVPLIFGGSLTASHTRTFTLVFITVSIQDQGSGA